MDTGIFSKIKKGEIIPAFTLKNIKGQDISSVEFLEKQCPECGVSSWPED